MHNVRLKRKEEDHRASIKWRSPPRGCIKGNFDGAAKGNLGKVGIGGIIRDHAGNTIDAIAIPIGISTSHRVEATAALYTMKVAVETGYRFPWLEGDSLNIINMLNNKTPNT